MKRVSSLFGALLLGALLSGCGAEQQAASADSAAVQPQQAYKWKMVTSWPKNFPGLGHTPEVFAKYVDEMSNGRLKIKVYGAGELVPGLGVFDAVSQGTVEMGHSAGYYWKGKVPAAQIFTAVPFGMNAQEVNAWLHYGGGIELYREVYKPFGIIPFAGGNTGVQFAGWFKKEVNSIDDLKGLKMRIPGMGGEVLQQLGGVPVTLTGGEIFTALQTGAIDATEWVGPYNDLAFGLHKATKHYYYSGWHEPGAMLEFQVNEKAFNALPKDLQAIVEVAARAANQDMLDEYTARNNAALQDLVSKHNVELKALPKEVMMEFKRLSREVIAEQAESDPMMKKVYDSYKKFLDGVSKFHQYSEVEYYKNRAD